MPEDGPERVPLRQAGGARAAVQPEAVVVRGAVREGAGVREPPLRRAVPRGAVPALPQEERAALLLRQRKAPRGLLQPALALHQGNTLPSS